MKRIGLFLLVVATMLAAVVLPLAVTPSPAAASINSVVWLNTAYKGYDPMLDAHVQAYESGSTATLVISLQNTTGDVLYIKGAKVKLDWTGGEYTAAAGNYPASLADDESGAITISFTVPETSVASNQATHNYSIYVDWEKEGGQKVGEQVANEVHYTYYAGQTNVSLNHDYIDPSSVRVLVNETLRTDYTVDCDDGLIVFASPGLADDAKVAVDYMYVEYVGWGDGTETEFSLNYTPVVAGTPRIWVDCALTTAYTLDTDTGDITFATAPPAGRSVIADYSYLSRWTATGGDFAVYTADQNSAMAVKQQLTAVGSPGVATAGSRKLLAESAMEEQLGDQKYAAGSLDEAKAHYDEALALLDKALKRDKDPNTFKLLEPTGALLLGIGMVLLALGVIVYVLKRPKGPSPS